MPRLPIAEQALRLALLRPTASQSQFVCRACIRQYHPSPTLRAELPFWKRMTNSLFGSKEDKAVAEKRDEVHQKRLDELREQGGATTETYTDDAGRVWTIAAIVDPSLNKEYIQAQRWDGLEWVGSKEWVARRNDSGEAYIGFNPRRKLELDAAQWRRVLHHVAVEVLALAQAGRDINAVYTERAVNIQDWMRTARVQIKQTEGAIELGFPTNEDMESILKAMPQSLAEEIVKAAENAETQSAEGIEVAAAESAEQHDAKHITDFEEKITMRSIKHAVKMSCRESSMDKTCLQISLADPAVKLAILKRIQQLTGHRVPDHAISTAASINDLYFALKTKPEPAKLKDSKQLKKLKADLPNVTVHEGRQTPIHKHKEVGRWKVIEEELVIRGLPVTGTRWRGARTSSPVH